MTRAASFALFLLALVGADLATALEFPDPTRFEPEIQAFERQDAAHPPPKGAIVLTGSSSIRLWGDRAAQALAPLTVIQRGFGGSVMHDLVYYLDRVALQYAPRAIVIYEGDNDTGGYPPIPNEAVLADLRQIIAKIHQRLPETRIYLLSVKPSVLRRARWPAAQALNAEFRKIADSDPQVHYIDVVSPLLQADGTVRTDIFLPDTLHLNEAGYALWGPAVRAVLMPLEARHEAHAR